MVVIYTSTTVPINSSNDAGVLTSADFWKVLEHKCRNPVAFVKPITDCRIIREEHDEQTGQLTSLTRLVTVSGEEAEIEEVAVLKKPVMVRLSTYTADTFMHSALSSWNVVGCVYHPFDWNFDYQYSLTWSRRGGYLHGVDLRVASSRSGRGQRRTQEAHGILLEDE